MKVLLDENLPKRLTSDFPDIEIFTAREKGWNGKSNGELLNLMLSENFDVLMTFDKNIGYQQNFKKFPIPVIVLIEEDNTYLNIKKLIPKIRKVLCANPKPGITEIQ